MRKGDDDADAQTRRKNLRLSEFGFSCDSRRDGMVSYKGMCEGRKRNESKSDGREDTRACVREGRSDMKSLCS